MRHHCTSSRVDLGCFCFQPFEILLSNERASTVRERRARSVERKKAWPWEKPFLRRCHLFVISGESWAVGFWGFSSRASTLPRDAGTPGTPTKKSRADATRKHAGRGCSGDAGVDAGAERGAARSTQWSPPLDPAPLSDAPFDRRRRAAARRAPGHGVGRRR